MQIESMSSSEVGNLTVVQFAVQCNTMEFIAAPTALKNRLIEICEVSAAGNVNQLIVANPSANFVFFMDGDILAGAKQNRVLNTSILLAPRTETLVPVSCVEQGRWRFTSKTFGSADHSATTSLRSLKSSALAKKMFKMNDYSADQGEVWEHVAALKASHGSNAPTNNLSDIFHDKRHTIEEELRSFSPVKEANGLAVFLGESLLSFDVFNRPGIAALYFPKILRGTLLESLGRRVKPTAETITEAHINRLLEYGWTTAKSRPSVGVGVEERFESEEVVGFRLTYNECPIHIAILNSGRTTTFSCS